jgi:hypothetical protein
VQTEGIENLVSKISQILKRDNHSGTGGFWDTKQTIPGKNTFKTCHSWHIMNSEQGKNTEMFKKGAASHI